MVFQGRVAFAWVAITSLFVATEDESGLDVLSVLEGKLVFVAV